MRFSWGAVYALFYLYRCAFSVLAQVVFLRLTSVPDTTGYQASNFGQFSQFRILLEGIETGLLMERNANLLTQIFASSLNAVTGGNAILINIGFQTVAFVGLLAFLKGLDTKTRIFVLLLVMTPSFSIWSSMASKEAIVVGLVGIFARYIVDIYNNRDSIKIYHLITLGILFMYKPQFFPAIIFVAATSNLARYFREAATIAVLAASASLVALYFFRDRLDLFSRGILRGILLEPGRSQRVLSFSDQYDIFFQAPGGMIRAFIGPTISEAAGNFLQMMTLVESFLILGALTGFVIIRLPRIPAYSAVIALFTVFWTMLANYPLGLVNPGTAIRYRTDYMLLIILAVAVLTSRNMYIDWRRNLLKNKSNKRFSWGPPPSRLGLNEKVSDGKSSR